MAGRTEHAAQVSNTSAWVDASGNAIHAHGGHMVKEGDYYYWFGENRTGRRRVSCYRSNNLADWEFRRDVLTLDSPVKPVYYRTSLELEPKRADGVPGKGANIERPKVLYNEATGQYVMWMHWENGWNYSDARCAVATCDTVDGEYVYRGSFNPIGGMSRDCTLFQDDDGTAYFLSAARDNADLIVYRLTPDYLAIEEQVKTLWPGQYREAPVLLKREGVYFLITSACTGWLPNQGMYAWADRLTGRWSPLMPLGDATTFDTQPAFAVSLRGGAFLYVGDRWDPSDYQASAYVFLPLQFPSEREMRLDWADMVTIQLSSGAVTGEAGPGSGMHRLKSTGTGLYAGVADTDALPAGMTLSYGDEGQKWLVEPADEYFVRLRNVKQGRYLAVETADGGVHKAALASDQGDGRRLDWKLRPASDEEGQQLIENRSTGLVLSARKEEGSRTARLTVEAERAHDPREGRNPQWFELVPVR